MAQPEFLMENYFCVCVILMIFLMEYKCNQKAIFLIFTIYFKSIKYSSTILKKLDKKFRLQGKNYIAYFIG